MNEVHIWSIPLEHTGDLARYHVLLAPDEQARASRFYFERDAHHYTVGRATLRLILSHYRGIAPAALQFTYNEYGKPALVHAQNPDGLEFNLSHSGGQALCALTYGHAVGVDIEAMKRLDYLQLATTVFSAHEQATLQRLPAAVQPRAFFNGWTRKEAYIKAHGKGLSMPLADFDVTLAPDDPVRLLATRPDATEATQWSLFGWSVGTTHVAALAVAGQEWQLVWHESSELK